MLLNKPVGYVSGRRKTATNPRAGAGESRHPVAREDASGLRQARYLRHLVPARPARHRFDRPAGADAGRPHRQAADRRDQEVEKEYLVRVQSTSGERLVGPGPAPVRTTASSSTASAGPARVEWVNDDQLRFVLVEGKKRQIRPHVRGGGPEGHRPEARAHRPRDAGRPAGRPVALSRRRRILRLSFQRSEQRGRAFGQAASPLPRAARRDERRIALAELGARAGEVHPGRRAVGVAAAPPCSKASAALFPNVARRVQHVAQAHAQAEGCRGSAAARCGRRAPPGPPRVSAWHCARNRPAASTTAFSSAVAGRCPAAARRSPGCRRTQCSSVRMLITRRSVVPERSITSAFEVVADQHRVMPQRIPAQAEVLEHQRKGGRPAAAQQRLQRAGQGAWPTVAARAGDHLDLQRAARRQEDLHRDARASRRPTSPPARWRAAGPQWYSV